MTPYRESAEPFKDKKPYKLQKYWREMSDNMMTTTIAIIIALVVGGAIYAGCTYESNKRVQEYELRKLYVEKCKMTPIEAETNVVIPPRGLESK